jgi:hypothetical protein
MALDIADIKAEFGAYYLKQGQNLQRLVGLLFRQSVTESLLTPIITDETVYQAARTLMTRVLQPFQVKFTPLAGVTFEPVAIQQFKFKIDVAEYPDELEATWLGFLTGEGIKRSEWPFIRWYIESYLIPQSQEDFEMLEIYNGVYQKPADGVAGAPGTTMNGLRKAINDQVTAGRIEPIVTGALSTDPLTLVDQIESFVDKIAKAYWRIPMTLGVSEEVQRRFLRGQERKYGKNTGGGELGEKVNKTNITVLGAPSMDDSNKIWCTPKPNAILLKKRTSNEGKFEVENVDRQLKVYSDWSKGAGFIIPEIVFSNDQDLD